LAQLQVKNCDGSISKGTLLELAMKAEMFELASVVQLAPKTQEFNVAPSILTLVDSMEELEASIDEEDEADEISLGFESSFSKFSAGHQTITEVEEVDLDDVAEAERETEITTRATIEGDNLEITATRMELLSTSQTEAEDLTDIVDRETERKAKDVDHIEEEEDRESNDEEEEEEKVKEEEEQIKEEDEKEEKVKEEDEEEEEEKVEEEHEEEENEIVEEEDEKVKEDEIVQEEDKKLEEEDEKVKQEDNKEEEDKEVEEEDNKVEEEVKEVEEEDIKEEQEEDKEVEEEDNRVEERNEEEEEEET